MNILIAGATSFIGRAVTDELIAEGNEVYALIRPDSPNAGKLPSYESFHCVDCDMYWLRGRYYKWIKKMSNVDQIEHFTGFGLYDRDFLEVLKKLDDPTPFLRGIVAELGYRRKEIPYTQPKRRAGKTSNNFYSLYDAAMLITAIAVKATSRGPVIFSQERVGLHNKPFKMYKFRSMGDR